MTQKRDTQVHDFFVTFWHGATFQIKLDKYFGHQSGPQPKRLTNQRYILTTTGIPRQIYAAFKHVSVYELPGVGWIGYFYLHAVGGKDLSLGFVNLFGRRNSGRKFPPRNVQLFVHAVFQQQSGAIHSYFPICQREDIV